MACLTSCTARESLSVHLNFSAKLERTWEDDAGSGHSRHRLSFGQCEEPEESDGMVK